MGNPRIRPEGMTRNQYRAWKRKQERHARGLKRPATKGADGIEIFSPPSPDLTPEELVAERLERCRRRRDYEDGRKIIDANVLQDGPIAILHFGDPHIDDDGTDLEALIEHMNIVKATSGMYCANLGDTQNAWVGRLSRLWSQQHTTAREARILAEWFLRELEGKWLYLVGGNHDAWLGEGDPCRWVAEQIGALHEKDELRIRLNFPNGRMVTMNVRHNWEGTSQWNPAHAVAKSAQLGIRDDITLGGHKHQNGYNVVVNPENGHLCHCVQVASYKVWDSYKRERGFRDQHISPCVVTVIDPSEDDPRNLVQIFWEPRRAAEFLTSLRRRKAV